MARDPEELPSHRKISQVLLGQPHKGSIRTSHIAINKNTFAIFAVGQKAHAINIRKGSLRACIPDHASAHTKGAHLRDVIAPFPKRCKHPPCLPPRKDNDCTRTTRARIAMTRPVRVAYDGVRLDRRDHRLGMGDCTIALWLCAATRRAERKRGRLL